MACQNVLVSALDCVMSKWDQAIDGVGIVFKVADSITPNVEPPPYLSPQPLAGILVREPQDYSPL